MVFGFGRKKKRDGDGGPGRGADASRPGDPGDLRQNHLTGLRGSGADNDNAAASPDSAGVMHVTLDDIPGILSRHADLGRRQAVSEARQIRDAAEPFVDELIRMGHDLEQDDLDVDSIDRHLAIIVVRGKKQVIDIIQRSVSPLPAIEMVEDAARAESALGQLLKKVGDVLGRQTRVIHIFAKKHANRFKENLAELTELHAEMRRVLDRHSRDESERSEMSDMVGAISAAHGERARRRQKVVDTESGIGDLKRQISDADAAVSEIMSSPGYQKYVALLSEAKQCDNDLARVRDEVRSQFAKISRPLGRYEYGSSLDKEQRRLLSSMVSDPAGVVTSENLDTVSVILSNVSRAVVSGSISVRDVDKTLEMISETSDAAESLAKRADECRARRRELEGKASLTKPDKLDEYGRHRTKATALLKDGESKMSALRAEIADDDSAIPQKVFELQIRLRQHTGARYELAVPA